MALFKVKWKSGREEIVFIPSKKGKDELTKRGAETKAAYIKLPTVLSIEFYKHEDT